MKKQLMLGLVLLAGGCVTTLPDKNNTLKEAVITGDMSTVQRMLDSGADVNTTTGMYLSTNCNDDLVVEMQANAKAGWIYSEQDTTVENEEIDASGEWDTVKAQVVFKGGDPPTFMQNEKTFTLVLENGELKISGMDPAPRNVGPGFSPL